MPSSFSAILSFWVNSCRFFLASFPVSKAAFLSTAFLESVAMFRASNKLESWVSIFFLIESTFAFLVDLCSSQLAVSSVWSLFLYLSFSSRLILAMLASSALCFILSASWRVEWAIFTLSIMEGEISILITPPLFLSQSRIVLRAFKVSVEMENLPSISRFVSKNPRSRKLLLWGKLQMILTNLHRAAGSSPETSLISSQLLM